MKSVALTLAFVVLAACLDFDRAYASYCSDGRCSRDGGRLDGGDTAVGPCDAGLCSRRSFDIPHAPVNAVVALGPQSVFAGANYGAMTYFDGRNFSLAQLPRSTGFVTGLSAVSQSTVFAAGAANAVESSLHRWNGTQWQPETIPIGARVREVLAVSDAFAVAVTSTGGTLLWDANAWHTGPSFVAQGEVSDIHSCGHDVYWMSSKAGEIIRWQLDAGFQTAYADTQQTALHAVWCDSGSGVWVVGSQGYVLHDALDGGGFQRFDAGVTAELRSVWVSANGDVWMCGTARSLLRFRQYTAGERSAYNVPPYGIGYYTDIHGYDNQLWVGGNFTGSGGDGGALLHYEVGL